MRRMIVTWRGGSGTLSVDAVAPSGATPNSWNVAPWRTAVNPSPLRATIATGPMTTSLAAGTARTATPPAPRHAARRCFRLP